VDFLEHLLCWAGYILDHDLLRTADHRFFLFKQPLPSLLSALTPTVFGAVIGRSQLVYHALTALYDYDRRTAKLKKLIAELKTELGLEPLPVATAQTEKVTTA
jgi:hypothetical protein